MAKLKYVYRIAVEDKEENTFLYTDSGRSITLQQRSFTSGEDARIYLDRNGAAEVRDALDGWLSNTSD